MDKVIAIIGPTASGKTAMAVSLCQKFNGEIVSADSRQVYRGLDLGTGKDLDDFITSEGVVPYHLIDVVEPNQDYHLFRYVKEARAAIEDVRSRGKLPVIVGGTPLYLNALIDGYLLEGCEPDSDYRAELEQKELSELVELLHQASPEYYERTDKQNKRRVIRSLEIIKIKGPKPTEGFPPLNALLIAPFFERKIMHQRIEQRLDARFEAGMVEEVATLHRQGVTWERLDWFGLEYRYIAKFLQQELSFEEMRELLLIQIRKFCKRQDIWYRKMEREGKDIYWLPEGNLEMATSLCQMWLDGKKMPFPEIRLNDIVYGPRNS